MSGRDARLEALLAELRSPRTRRPASGPELDLSSGTRAKRGELILQRDEREDPLTGHRGVAEGLHLLVRAGTWLVDLQLRDGRDGVVLRGQLLPSEPGGESPAGALVHAIAPGEARMACVDAGGEFVLRGQPATEVQRLVLELEDGLHELPWPSGSES